MRSRQTRGLTLSRCLGVAIVVSLGAVAGAVAVSHADEPGANQLASANASGVLRTVAAAGAIDTGNPFFQDLGTNGRTCFTCHRPDQAWSVSPGAIRDRFTESAGLDPIFRNNDGSNCKGADLSTLAARQSAFSLLMNKGLIRVEMQVPAGADFDVVDVDDPYGCGAPYNTLSMYRRPLPTTNLAFLSTVMWDGRETVKGQAIRSDLVTQASNATTGHAEGSTPTTAQLQAIVAFELSLSTAQARIGVPGACRQAAHAVGRRRLHASRSVLASTIR